MGKLKTKYPVEVSIQFFLFLQNSQLLRDTYGVSLDSGSLQYSHVDEQFSFFRQTNQIQYEAYMFFQSLNSDQQELMRTEWALNINEIEERGRYIMIRVKSHTQYVKDLIYEEINAINSRIDAIQNKFSGVLKKEESDSRLVNTAPTLNQVASSSSSPSNLPFKDLDIAILFSEPIFDEKKHQEANLPVDFRSQIQRLYSSLNNSYKPQITVKCEIGTKEHLKHLIGFQKPKILHIICHGSKHGELQLEDDSNFALGTLCTIDTAKIRQILQSQKQSIPKLVFVNSCYSQLIGRVFFQVGAKYVIMIDSQDKIDDEAAQIFSENFYRNIFRGERVEFSFKEAKDTVGIKHNSFGCCCRHTAREKHRVGCRWLILSEQLGLQQAHKLYHIPSQKCTCQLRNLNRHKLTCEWARFSLFHINKDFRIKGANGKQFFPTKMSELPSYLPYQKKELTICCCFNFEGDSTEPRIPHSECNKFKMLAVEQENPQPLYQLQKNVYFRTQIIDYSAPELLQYHEKVQNSCVMGRQQELYEFMKTIKDPQISIFFLYGQPGVGKTSFSVKTATYLVERRIYTIYFFIDLYNIKDREMFRNKFNEVTKFGYPSNKVSLGEVRGKNMIIIFDNADEFFMQSMIDFVEQFQALRKQLFHTKFIITCKQKNFSALENEEILTNNCFVKELKVLDENVAARALFSKIRNYLDISIQYMDIRGLIANKKELQIPKVIQNLSHSFSNMKTKVKLSDLKTKIDNLGAGDFAFNKLVEENLNILKTKCKQSYQMLIFISQFSQGIDKNDFNILSMYDRNDNSKEAKNFRNRLDFSIDIPIDKNWRRRLAVLFERYKQQESQQISKDSETQSIESQPLPFEKHSTMIWQNQKSQKQIREVQQVQEDALMFKGESYFLQQLSKNRFIVKRFIRDFIWNKDESAQNYYMKHIFVAFTAVMLDIYLKFLVQQKYIHEELLEYSDISDTGVFKYKDNNYIQCSLTQSVRYAEQYNSRFEMILKEQPSLRQKIMCSDPSVFILNHKLDFLHIYAYDWTKVYEYLQKTRKKQATILIKYLQKLITLIPTALKIANVEDSLIQYSIRQSIQLLAQIRRFGKPGNNLLLTLKLKLMKVSSQVQKGQKNSLTNIQFQRDFHKNDLQQINGQILIAIKTQYNFQFQLLRMYSEYLNVKELKKITEQSTRGSVDRLIEITKKLQNWKNQEAEWQQSQNCQILNAKRKLVLSMIYFKVLEMSTKYLSNFTILNFKKGMTPIFVSYAKSAAKLFQSYKLIKLCLRAKLIEVSIGWQVGKYRAKQTEFNRELQQQRQKLKECQRIFEDKTNNLIGLTYFDVHIKKIRKQMKEKMWQQSANNFIFMKAVPLSNKQNALLENAVRKKQKYRRNLEKIFTNAKIDISLKFQILTIEKLQEETKRKCSILLLNTNIKIESNRVYLVFQGNDLKQKFVEINAQFIQKYPVGNAKLFIVMGRNASAGVKKISQLLTNPPSMVAITSSESEQFDQFQEFNFEELGQRGTNQLKKMIERNIKIAKSQISLAQQFIQRIIDINNTQKGVIEIFEQLRSNLSEQLKQIKVEIVQNKDNFIQIIPGTYKDVSPGYRKAHNIDVDFHKCPQLIYRKWKEINDVFRQLSSKSEPKYIHICGNYGSGKTTFLEQIGRMFIERGMFENGVYIINGKDVEEKYQSDFEAYILKNSETGNIFTLQSFNRYANSNFMLMIDDFHLIKPRSNGRYNIFLNRLIDKKVNLILVTHETFNIRDIFPSIRTVKIQKMNQFELNIYAYNILDSPGAVQEYEAEKKKKKISLQDIFRIKQKYKALKGVSQFNNFLPLPYEESLKKMASLRN